MVRRSGLLSQRLRTTASEYGDEQGMEPVDKDTSHTSSKVVMVMGACCVLVSSVPVPGYVGCGVKIG